MILSQPQAEAVYSAMCALNNVNARLHARDVGRTDEGLPIQIHETETGVIVISTGTQVLERYGTQGRFAAAHGLEG